MRLAPGAAVAGVFTQNRFCAAPVIAREEASEESRFARWSSIPAMRMRAPARTAWRARSRVCTALASQLNCKPTQVLPFSTGVIMEPLPVDRIVAGLPRPAGCEQDNWLDAAEAIMTTDTVPKAFSRKVKLSGGEATVTGIAKGAGMIHPDMATMLGFVATDAKVSAQKALQSDA